MREEFDDGTVDVKDEFTEVRNIGGCANGL